MRVGRGLKLFTGGQVERIGSRPLRGAWIEITPGDHARIPAESPPRGAWIEIGPAARTFSQISVAPRRGAWIEIRQSHLR